MSIEELSLVLYDTFQMDVCFPSWSILNKEFEKSGYSLWAMEELKSYISEKLYPRTSGTIKEFIRITADFKKKMSEYSKVNPNNNLMFTVADNISSNVLEVLRAME